MVFNKIGQVDSEEIDLIGHEDPIRSIDWSPDGSLVATSSINKSLKIWNPIEGNIKWSFNFESSIRFIQWNSEGTKIIVFLAPGVDSNTSLKILDISKGTVQSEIQFSSELESMLGSLQPNSNILALTYFSLDSTGEIRRYRLALYDLTTNKFFNIISTNRTSSLNWVNNGKKLAFLEHFNDKMYVTVWDSTTNNFSLSFVEDDFIFFSSNKPVISFSPNNSLLALSRSYQVSVGFIETTKYAVTIYDLNSTEIFMSRLRLDSRVTALSWKSNDEIFVGTSNNGARIWKINPIHWAFDKDEDVQAFLDLETGIRDLDWDENNNNLAFVYINANNASLFTIDEIPKFVPTTTSTNFLLIFSSIILISLYKIKRERLK
ncbi:MAG: hypothetical protein HeimC3_46400 [Candidatus Heimdallarchaeota archaeon LC_3]|nr:MAG: hypothetical protein HeimC3_46400 [Candidatus Heimdallarchaeota archaeon LC_3]